MSKFKPGDMVVQVRDYVDRGTDRTPTDLPIGYVTKVITATYGEINILDSAGVSRHRQESGYELHVAGSTDTKDTNPKQAYGDAKAQLALVPDSMQYAAALCFFEGMTKYGSYNWRVSGVRASTYKSAAERHLKKWFNGEDVDQTTGVPHLSSVLGCIAIIIDADLCGKLEDDRPPKLSLAAIEQTCATIQARIRELNKDIHPHHNTAKDVP